VGVTGFGAGLAGFAGGGTGLGSGLGSGFGSGLGSGFFGGGIVTTGGNSTVRSGSKVSTLGLSGTVMNGIAIHNIKAADNAVRSLRRN
jgi:hypothetical protein